MYHVMIQKDANINKADNLYTILMVDHTLDFNRYAWWNIYYITVILQGLVLLPSIEKTISYKFIPYNNHTVAIVHGVHGCPTHTLFYMSIDRENGVKILIRYYNKKDRITTNMCF